MSTQNHGTRSMWMRRVLRGAVGIVALVVLAVGVFWGEVYFGAYPAGCGEGVPAARWLEDRGGREMGSFVGAGQQWYLPVEVREISPHLLQAIVAVEDHRFFEHQGVDWRAAVAAAWGDLWGHRLRGASTLTMQLQRLREGREGRSTWGQKVWQAVHACQMERRTGKEAILVEYLNRAPFGGNVTGVGATSWRYFGKKCGDLSLGQAALLAGLPQSPNRFRPDRFGERALGRRDFVLGRMVACGMISGEEFARAVAEPLAVVARASEGEAEGLLPTALRLVARGAGARVRATLDAGVQGDATRALREALGGLRATGVTSGAVVVMEVGSGEVLASVSLSEEAPGVELTRARRSSGSALKPFIYAAAMENGDVAMGTVLDDSPKAWGGYVPRNSDRGFRGPLTAREALAESRNIPAMTVLAKTGVERAIGCMAEVGIQGVAGRRAESYGLSLAIGGAEVSAAELAEGYATLARGGRFVAARWVMGEGANATGAEGKQALPAWVCGSVLHAISAEARTRAVCAAAVSAHPAWKTGTSNGNRDAWCVAVTRHYAVVVWLGRSKGEGVSTLTGIDMAAPVCLGIVAGLPHRDEPEWEEIAGPYADEVAKAHKPAELPLAIVRPGKGSRIILTREESADRQRVALEASGGMGETWWFVDDEPLGRTHDRETLWWTPSVGRHEIRAVDGASHSASAAVTVSPEPR